MPSSRFPVLVILAAVLAVPLGFILREALGTALTDYVLDLLAPVLGREKGQMIAAITPYLLPGTLAGLCIYAAYEIGAYDHASYQPSPDLDARKAFSVVIGDKRWLKKHTETDPEKLKTLRSDYLLVRLANEIHDALAQGRIWGWGEKNLSVGTGPLDRIAPIMWHDIIIDFSPSHPEMRTMALSRESGRMLYVNILFSADQFAKSFKVMRRLLKRV